MSESAAGSGATLYHSGLVQASQEWAIVTVQSGPSKSKYAGKPNYFKLMLDGVGRLYNVENPHCEAALAAVVGKEVQIKATGRAAEARIEVATMEGAAIEVQEPAAAPAAAPAARPAAVRPGSAPGARPAAAPAAQAPKPAQSQRAPFLEAQAQSEQLLREAWRSVMRLNEALMQEQNEPLTAEQQQAAASAFFYHWKDNGYRSDMPVEPLLAPQEDAP